MGAISRKSPRQSRAKETVDCILAAAAHILETTYPAGFTTNRIATAAGVSIGSLYQYYSSKEAIVLALILREKERVVAIIERLCDSDTAASFPSVITELIRQLVVFHQTGFLLHKVLEAEERHFYSYPALIAVNNRISRANAALFLRFAGGVGLDPNAVSYISNDVRCIVKGILESELGLEPVQADELLARLSRAVFGYLDATRNAARKGLQT